jgi:hypothetical protein
MTRPSPRPLPLALALPLLLAGPLAACSPVLRPTRFFDLPAIVDMADDQPIALPKPHDPVREAALTMAYVERPMVEALDPTHAPPAGDVNALDEMPRSTWCSPADAEPAGAEPADDAEEPAPPLRLLAGPALTHEHALAVVDARGRRFEIWRDPPDRPEMATGAAAASARLLRALGYFTPGEWATDFSASDFVMRDAADTAAVTALIQAGPRPGLTGLFRVGATRWPIGQDLGPTPATGQRSDDPNDKVPHEDRRSLRALKLVFGWLGMTQGDVLRDAYLGAPGRGHVVHYLAGLSGALGADAVVRPQPPRDDDSDLARQNVWITLGTLGLYTQKPRLTPERWPALGEYRETWKPSEFQTGPPLTPLDRALPGDLYWAAKRIAALSTAVVVRALDAGHYHDDSARALLQDKVRDRQRTAVRWAFSLVTPVEVDRLDQRTAQTPAALVLRDEAISLGIGGAVPLGYDVEMVDDRGLRLVERRRMGVTDAAIFPVRLPDTAASYVVVRVRAYRAGGAPPRAMEVHLVRGGLAGPAAWRVVGVMH